MSKRSCNFQAWNQMVIKANLWVEGGNMNCEVKWHLNVKTKVATSKKEELEFLNFEADGAINRAWWYVKGNCVLTWTWCSTRWNLARAAVAPRRVCWWGAWGWTCQTRRAVDPRRLSKSPAGSMKLNRSNAAYSISRSVLVVIPANNYGWWLQRHSSRRRSLRWAV